MATPLRSPPRIEPCTDFPTPSDIGQEVPCPRRTRPVALVLLAAGALLIGSLGYLIGRESAPVPEACRRAAALGERVAVTAIADLSTIREGMLVFLDGERTEADSILSEARLDVEELERLQVRLAEAAEGCRSG